MKNHRWLGLFLLGALPAVLPLSAAVIAPKSVTPEIVSKPGDSGTIELKPNSTSAASKNAYHLRVNDTINLDVVDDPKASLVEYKIEADGTVRPKYLKDPVQLAGLTVNEAVAVVAKAYKDNEVFTDPQIAIQVKSYAERKVNAIGSVNNPHPVVIPPGEDATLVSVITACGGPASIAGHTVRVTRKLADGRISNFEVNLKDAFKDARKDIPLQDGDTVWLLESPIGGEWVGW